MGLRPPVHDILFPRRTQSVAESKLNAVELSVDAGLGLRLQAHAHDETNEGRKEGRHVGTAL
jgi:hypothetical protein